MSYIHFKFVYNKNYDKITFDGVSLSLSQLKKLIVEKNRSKQQVDFDLEITNADTNEVYQNENDMVMKNTRVNVKRVVKSSSTPLRAQPPKASQQTHQEAQIAAKAPNTVASTAAISYSNTSYVSFPPPFSSATSATNSVLASSSTTNPVSLTPTVIPAPTVQAAVSSAIEPSPAPAPTTSSAASSNQLPKAIYDSLAPLNLPSKPIVYVTETTDSSSNAGQTGADPTSKASSDDPREDEKAKLESFLLSSQMTSGFGPNGSSTGSKFPGIIQRNRPLNSYRFPLNNNNMDKSQPNAKYQENGGAKKMQSKTDEKPYVVFKHPSGIPRTMMIQVDPTDKFAMYGPDGFVVTGVELEAYKTTKKEATLFPTEEEEEEMRQKKLREGIGAGGLAMHVPKELRCPYGDHIIKDAVLMPCCGHFICCDECVRAKMSNNEDIECPYSGCEIGALASITPDHKMRKMVTEYLNDVKLANQRASTTSAMAASLSTKTDGDIFNLLIGDMANESSPLVVAEKSEAASALYDLDMATEAPSEMVLSIHDDGENSSSFYDRMDTADDNGQTSSNADMMSSETTGANLSNEADQVTSTSMAANGNGEKAANDVSIMADEVSGITSGSLSPIDSAPSDTPNNEAKVEQPTDESSATPAQAPLITTPPGTLVPIDVGPVSQQYSRANIPIIDMTNLGNNRGMHNQGMMNYHPNMMRPGMMNHGYPQQLGQPMHPMGMGMPQQPMYNQPPYNQQQPNPGGYMNRPPFYPNQPMNMMNDGSGVPGNPNMYNQQPLLNHQLPPMNPTAGGGGPIRQQPNMMPPGIPPNQMYPNSSTNLNQNMMNKSMMPPHAMMQPPSLLSHPLQLHVPPPNVGAAGAMGMSPHQGSMMPQAVPGGAGGGIMSKEEFYKYQEKLRKDAESQKYKKHSRRSRSRSKGRSYSKSRSKSYSRSRSRSYDSRSPRSVDSRGSPVKRSRRSRNSPSRSSRRYNDSSYKYRSSHRDSDRDRNRGYRDRDRYSREDSKYTSSSTNGKRRSRSRSNGPSNLVNNSSSSQYKSDRNRRRSYSRSRSPLTPRTSSTKQTTTNVSTNFKKDPRPSNHVDADPLKPDKIKSSSPSLSSTTNEVLEVTTSNHVSKSKESRPGNGSEVRDSQGSRRDRDRDECDRDHYKAKQRYDQYRRDRSPSPAKKDRKDASSKKDQPKSSSSSSSSTSSSLKSKIEENMIVTIDASNGRQVKSSAFADLNRKLVATREQDDLTNGIEMEKVSSSSSASGKSIKTPKKHNKHRSSPSKS